MNTDITVDLTMKLTFGGYAGLLTLPNGDQYDVYGDTIAELKKDANNLAGDLGVTIDVWNLELPE